MRRLVFLAGLIMLVGCAKAPTNNTSTTVDASSDSSTQQEVQDPNAPDSFGVVKVCHDGTKVYLLTGGAASGQYAVWDTAGKGSWELLETGVTPESVCSN